MTPSPTTPWRGRTRLTVAAGVAAGSLLTAAGWLQARRTDAFASQLDGAALSATGLACIGLACLVWVLVGRHELRRRLARILPPMDALVRAEPSGLEITAVDSAQHGSGGFVASSAMGRFHRPTCLMAEGKQLETGSAAVHIRAGRRPCQVCRPDG